MTTTQIYNQQFKIDASLVNVDVTDNPQYMPLKYSAFDYIEITDSITDPPLSGYAVLNNYKDLINSSHVFEFAKLYNNIFNFKVEQITGTSPLIFDNTFVLTDIHTFPQSDTIDKLIVHFEDSFFGTLNNKTVDKPERVALFKQGLASDIMRNILNEYNNSDESTIGEWIDSTNEVDLQFDQRESIRNIFNLAYYNNYTSNTGGLTESIWNVMKDDGDVFNRTVTDYRLEPINKRFQELYKNLQSDKILNLTDSVMEGIAESGADASDTKTGMIKGFSEADKVQIFQPDPKIVRDLFRNTVVEHVDDSGSSSIAVIPILETFDNFFKLFCNNPNYRLDIPYDLNQLNDETRALDAIRISAYYPEIEPGITQARLYNAILFNSKLLTFQVKGQIYRQPGYFIYFQPRRRSPDDPHYFKNVGFWFVTEVKHIFEGNTYNNIVTCVNPFVRNNY